MIFLLVLQSGISEFSPQYSLISVIIPEAILKTLTTYKLVSILSEISGIEILGANVLSYFPFPEENLHRL